MAKFTTRLTAILLCLSMLVFPVSAAKNDSLTAKTSAGLSALGCESGTLLEQGAEFPAGTSLCDWSAMALARSGSAENYEQYLRDLQQYVEQCYAEEGGLDSIKSTPYHRIALTVLALGGDPENFGEKPDGTAIDLIADGTYAFAGESLGKQGLNGWIYALIALDASGVEVPEYAKFSRADMIEAIVTAQSADGGFGLMEGKSDVDITAMALQALAPYQNEYPQVIEDGLAYLAYAMDGNCRYAAYGEASAESSAQVILALCALGIDPDTDSRFSRGKNTLLTGLDSFRLEDGTYGHTQADTEGNHLATAQTLLALTALERLRSGESGIFDFTDYEGPVQKTAERSTVGDLSVVIGIGIVFVICIIIAGKRRKHGKSNG